MKSDFGFEHSIVIGTSTIAYQCAKVLKDICSVEVIEYPLISYSPLNRSCASASINYKSMNSEEIGSYLRSINKGVLIVSAFNTYLFPDDIVKKENFTIVNYHNSLLPKYAGRNAEAWVIFFEEKYTGVTWHRVNNIVDGGEILSQEKIKLDSDITSLQLIKKQHSVALSLFVKMLPEINCLSNKNQIEKPVNYFFSKEIPGNGEIDLEWSISKIYAFLRALDYGPLYLLGKPKIKIDGVTYFWERYKLISDNYLVSIHTKIIHEKDKIIIVEKDQGIILENIYEREGKQNE